MKPIVFKYKLGEAGGYLETLNPVSAVKKCNGVNKLVNEL
jgi:hypothetical protein